MANIVSPDWVIKHLAKGVAAGPDTTQPGDNANKALKTAFLSKHFYDAAGGVVLPEPRLAGKYLSNDGTNLFWADAPAALPTINPTGDDGKVVVRVNGEFTYRHIVPHPYPAGQTLFNDGSNLVWRNLPDLPTVDPTDEGKVLVVENNTVTWKTLVSGGSTPLPETAGNTGLVLSNDGTALNDGASLRWSTSSGETEKPPGTVIGYAHAYSIKDDSGDNTFTLEASVYPDHLSVIGTLKDPGDYPYQVLQWGNTSVETLDGSTPFGVWAEDGVFVFNRDCFVIVNATQHVYANYGAGTGYTYTGDVYLVHYVDASGDSYIVGGRAGVNFGYPYSTLTPPTVGGSFSCAITVATGDALSVKGLFVTVGGTGGTLDYGAIKTYVRPTFGILAMEGFPGQIIPTLPQEDPEWYTTVLYPYMFEDSLRVGEDTPLTMHLIEVPSDNLGVLPLTLPSAEFNLTIKRQAHDAPDTDAVSVNLLGILAAELIETIKRKTYTSDDGDSVVASMIEVLGATLEATLIRVDYDKWPAENVSVNNIEILTVELT